MQHNESALNAARYALLVAAAVVSSHVVSADADWKELPVPQKQTAVKRPGTKYGSLPDMIEACFPAICKIQGAVGDREYMSICMLQHPASI